MLAYAQLDLKLIPDDVRSIGENVEKSICAQRKSDHRWSLAGIPARIEQIGWPFAGR
jgi:hypothetical protein